MKEDKKYKVEVGIWYSQKGWVCIIEVATEGEDKHFRGYNA